MLGSARVDLYCQAELARGRWQAAERSQPAGNELPAARAVQPWFEEAQPNGPGVCGGAWTRLSVAMKIRVVGSFGQGGGVVLVGCWLPRNGAWE